MHCGCLTFELSCIVWAELGLSCCVKGSCYCLMWMYGYFMCVMFWLERFWLWPMLWWHCSMFDNNKMLNSYGLCLWMKFTVINHTICNQNTFFIGVFYRPWKEQKYALLLDGGLLKGYLWRIWVITDTPHPACRKRQHGAWRVLRYKWSLGLDKTNSPVVGGAPGFGFHPLPGPSRKWRPCPFPSLQFQIMAKLEIKFLAHTPGASGLIFM